MIYLAWSGGLDSTYALVELLRAGYSVHAHHVYYEFGRHSFTKDEEERAFLAWSRAKAEQKACLDIREYLKNEGFQFGYTETTLDFNTNPVRLDIFLVCLPYILNEAFQRGVSDTDRIVLSFNNQDSEQYRSMWFEEIWRSLVKPYCDWAGTTHIPVIRFGQWQDRAAHVDALGQEIASFTMSCTRPHFINGDWVPCGSDEKVIRKWAQPERSGRKACSCAQMIGLVPRYSGGWFSKTKENVNA